MNKGILVLENGDVFEGVSVGANTTRVGELCFNTGMTGYQELFTDPSYYGQMLVMTSNHIGNYGTLEADEENKKTNEFRISKHRVQVMSAFFLIKSIASCREKNFRS